MGGCSHVGNRALVERLRRLDFGGGGGEALGPKGLAGLGLAGRSACLELLSQNNKDKNHRNNDK